MTPADLRDRAARAKARQEYILITDSDALELAGRIEELEYDLAFRNKRQAATDTALLAHVRRAKVDSLQGRVREWMLACFGPQVAADKTERTWRFIEEALELAQAQGATSRDVCTLVDYVFARPVGEAHQEVGGVLLTLAALCDAVGLDMELAGEHELARVWGKIEVIREKQRTKPHGSPLPQAAPAPARMCTYCGGRDFRYAAPELFCQDVAKPGTDPDRCAAHEGLR